MDKRGWIYLVDVGLILSSLGVMITGLIKFRTLHHLLGMNLDYESMPLTLLRTIHDWTGFAMFVFVVLHIILHWGWIVDTTRHYFGGGTHPDDSEAEEKMSKAPRPKRRARL